MSAELRNYLWTQSGTFSEFIFKPDDGDFKAKHTQDRMPFRIKAIGIDGSTASCQSIRTNDFLYQYETVIEEEALSIDSPSLRLCEEFFAALPSDIPVPEISVDPDGEIAFDWDGGKGWLFSVSFSRRNRYSFASCDSAECPVPPHSRSPGAMCHRETSRLFPDWARTPF